MEMHVHIAAAYLANFMQAGGVATDFASLVIFYVELHLH